MSSTTERKKKASEKALPSYPAPSLPELLIQYDDWVGAARLFARDLMQQLYEPLVLGTTALIGTLDPDNLVVVELKAAKHLVVQMKLELAQRLYEFVMPLPYSNPCYKPRFNDPQVIERLAMRIERIKRLEERLSPRTERQVIWKALDYASGRQFDSAHPDAIKRLSRRRHQARLDKFTPEEGEKIIAAIDARAAGKK